MNTNTNTRKLKRVTVSRPQSRSLSPVRATLNTQNAFIGLATPEVAEPMNMSSIATRVNIKANMQKSRPSSATAYAPIAPQSVSYNRPKSATLVPLSLPAKQAHHGQLKTIHTLQHQQGLRRLIKTRRRKNRKSRKSRRNRRTTV